MPLDSNVRSTFLGSAGPLPLGRVTVCTALCTPWVPWTCTVTPLCTTATITGHHRDKQRQHSGSTDAAVLAGQCRFEIYTRNIERARKTAFQVWCRLPAELPGSYYLPELYVQQTNSLAPSMGSHESVRHTRAEAACTLIDGAPAPVTVERRCGSTRYTTA